MKRSPLPRIQISREGTILSRRAANRVLYGHVGRDSRGGSPPGPRGLSRLGYVSSLSWGPFGVILESIWGHPGVNLN